MTYTKDQIKEMLQSNDKAVVRGIMAIYGLQTDTERAYGSTIEHNKVGFSGCDAEILSSFAEQYKAKGYWSPRQWELARKKVLKYAGQLAKIANGKISRPH